MTLRSRLAALECAARQRQQRGYPVKPVWPRLEFDLTDPETVAFLAEMTELRDELPVRDPTSSGGGPNQRIQAALSTARFVMEDYQRTERWLAAIDRAIAVSPVHVTGASEHE